jgi:hypothetical protein
MGTKNKPGDFDCYAAAHPDEPMFILLGRDDDAPALVEAWADQRAARGSQRDQEKAAEARKCAAAMRDWRATTAERHEAIRAAAKAGKEGG